MNELIDTKDSRTPEEMEIYRLHRRFDRFGRLVGDAKMQKLMDSHVMVVGLGGVGSWAAEAISRSGVGKITIVDFDEVCITNTNRQLHALAGMVGKKKSELMKERLQKINPQSKIIAHDLFYDENSAQTIFSERPDYVIDAIDNVTTKCHLLKKCRDEGIPVVCSTGSAGRMDPTMVQVRDLAETEVDNLARSLRRILRQKYEFPSPGNFGIQAVFSTEPPFEPMDLSYDKGKGFTCVCPQGDNDVHSCDSRNVIWGSASFVTSVFGMTCASIVVRDLISKTGEPLKRSANPTPRKDSVDGSGCMNE